MFILDMLKLKEGDIILTAQTSVVSKTVRTFTDSNFSHAILHVGWGSYIHSDSKGVHSGNMQRLLLKKAVHAQVLRLKDDAAAQQLRKATAFARRQIGKQYTIGDAIRVKRNYRMQSIVDANRQFCSRLVAQAYADADVHLVDNPVFCSPEDLRRSPLLRVMDGCVRPASAAEMKFAKSDDPIARQTSITNYILRKARKVTGKDVQSFEQVLDVLRVYPRHDTELSEIFEESGYMHMWSGDIAKNPWRYDPTMFMALPVSLEQKRWIAQRESSIGAEQHAQYASVYSQVLQLWQENQLRYYSLNIMLYLTLCDLTKRRVEVADHVLRRLK